MPNPVRPKPFAPSEAHAESKGNRPEPIDVAHDRLAHAKLKPNPIAAALAATVNESLVIPANAGIHSTDSLPCAKRGGGLGRGSQQIPDWFVLTVWCVNVQRKSVAEIYWTK